MNCEDRCSLIGIYSFDLENSVYLLEMRINEKPQSVDLSLFFQKENNLPKCDWQTPYDEHYLTSDGKAVLGDYFNRGTIPGDITRVVFFMFIADLSIPLSTPYGEFNLTDVQFVPERLLKIISYNPID